MFVPCFDWNYLKLRSRLYRNFDCFVLLLIGDGGRDFLFSIEFDSRDGPRSVCSIVDLRTEVHLASVLRNCRSMTKLYSRYRSSKMTDRRIDFNRTAFFFPTFVSLIVVPRLKEERNRKIGSREMEKKMSFIKGRD